MNESIDLILSVREPYAHLLVSGIKTIENRSTPFPAKHKLPVWVAIHASQSLDAFAEVDEIGLLVVSDQRINAAWNKPFDEEKYKDVPVGKWPRIFGRSEIIGAVRVIGSVPYGEDEFIKDPKEVFAAYPDPDSYGDWAAGEHCWVLDKAIRFKYPIVTIGKLGVRVMPPDLKAIVNVVARDSVLSDPGDAYGKPIVHQLPKLPKPELELYQLD